ncbi:MAG: RNA-binding protein [Comamonas sp.]|nr:RNA-binding protein [Candidatus Comamonas equi]
MGSKLYVGNLPYGVRDLDLEQAFTQFGTVSSAKVMMERDTGRSKGFGFVEMHSESEANAAIQGMNGQPLGGRSLVVNLARPMEPRPPRTGGYGAGNFDNGRSAASNNPSGYAGRGEGGFRSPYGTGPRGRTNSNFGSYGTGNDNGGRYRNGE